MLYIYINKKNQTNKIITKSLNMKHTLYRVDGKLFGSQKALAFYNKFNVNTFRSKIERLGGLDSLKEITINNIRVEILTEYFN